MDPERLEGLPLFAGLDDEQRAEIANCTRGDGGGGRDVGEIGLLVTGNRTVSIVATTPMTLIAIFSRDFKRVEKRMPQIAESLRATMRERVARTSF